MKEHTKKDSYKYFVKKFGKFSLKLNLSCKHFRVEFSMDTIQDKMCNIKLNIIIIIACQKSLITKSNGILVKLGNTNNSLIAI